MTSSSSRNLIATAVGLALFSFLVLSVGGAYAQTTTAAPAPQLTSDGIVVAVFVCLLIVVVGSSMIGFIPAMFLFIIICHFAGIIDKKELLSGFSNGGVTAVALLSIILGPLGQLPIIKDVSEYLFTGDKEHRTWQLAKILIVTAVSSPLLPNAPHAQLFTPMVRDVAVRSGMHPKFVLMPMSMVICASNALVLGSASNLIASGVLEETSGESIAVADLAISNLLATVAIILMCLGLSHLMFPVELEDEPTSVGGGGANETPEQKPVNSGFTNQTCFTAMFQVFATSHSAKDIMDKSVGELLKWLPEEFANRVEIVEVIPMMSIEKMHEKAAAEAAAATTTTSNNEPTQIVSEDGTNNDDSNTNDTKKDEVSSSPTNNATAAPAGADATLTVPGDGEPITDKEEILAHRVSPNDRLVVIGDVGSLRAFRGLLGVAWVGVSEISCEKHGAIHRADSDEDLDNGVFEDVRTGRSDTQPEPSPPQRSNTSEGNDLAAGSDDNTKKSNKKKDDDATEMSEKKNNNDAAAAAKSTTDAENDDAEALSPITDTSSSSLEKTLKRNALYQVKLSPEGMDAFLPVDSEEMKKIRFAIVVIAHNNPAIGQRIESRLFVEQFRCAVVAGIRYRDGYHLSGRNLALHVLQAGDTLLVRLRPRSAPVFANEMNIRNFYDVEGLSDINPTDRHLKKSYVTLPVCLHCLPWGETIMSKFGPQRIIRMPQWFDNVQILIFIGIIVAATLGVDLSAASAVGVCLYVILGFISVREAIQLVDWELITGIALSFGIGTAMKKSQLADKIGYDIGNSGISGFTVTFIACLMIGFVAAIVSNKAAIQIGFPIAKSMFERVGFPLKMAAVVAANSSVSGFFTVFGTPTHMVIFGPGNYKASDFLFYGMPLFVVFNLLTAVMASVEYGAL